MSKLKKNTFLQGTLITSIVLILIKVLGALYVIPYYKIIGVNGGTLYSYAYNIYNLFLNISTAGIPVAISMIISEYLALENHNAKEKSYIIGKKITLVLSLVSFCLVFFGSNILAHFILSDVEGGHTVEEISLVIKAIAPCLLIIPHLSVLRGYMQGHKFVTPTSFAQLIEQIVRIVIVLIGSWVSIKLLHTTVSLGVAISLTGTFFGGLASLIYLKRKIKLNKTLFVNSNKGEDIESKLLIKKILSYCIPVVLISVTENIYTLTDIKLIIKGLNMINYSALEGEMISGIVSTWAPKICAIIITISMALTTNIIPHITESFVKNDKKGINTRINQALSTLLFITIPMSILLFLMSDEVYYIFYGNNSYGGYILKFSTISHVFLGISTIFNTTLQSMKKFKEIYINSIIGILVNTVLDIPIILLFNKLGLHAYVGTIVSTCIGYATSIMISIYYLNKELKISYKDTFSIIKRLLIPSIIVIIPIIILKSFINVEMSLISSILSIMVYGLYGIIVYILITYKNNALTDLFGDSLINKIKVRFKS